MSDARLRYIRLTKPVNLMTQSEVEDALKDTDLIIEELEVRWKELELDNSNMYV